MPKLLLVFLLAFSTCLFNKAYGANKPAVFVGKTVVPSKKQPPAKLRTDSSKITVKTFNAAALKAYRADKDHNYDTVNEDDGEASLWDRFWSWVWNKLFGRVKISPVAGSFIKYFFLTIALGLLVFFIFKLIGMDAINLWRGEARKTSLAYDESLENIHEINFDTEVEKAIAQHNYRLAVRLLYLKCLKQLSDNNLINWQIDKTNSAYVYELDNPAQKQAFSLLTRQFEYVWYGGFTIDGNAFNNINQLFQNFKKQLP